MTPLIRTEGKSYQSGYALSVDLLLKGDPLRVEARDSVARAAEHAMGLPASLYFYVGHACPAFGSVVLVYDLEQMQQSGSASDHDTGGLHAGYVHFKPELPPLERLRWSGEPAHRWPISEVPHRFNDFVRRWFVGPSAYFTGERALRDDEVGRLHHPKNERRAWSVEVRLEQDHPLFDGVRLIGLEPAAHEAIRQATAEAPGTHATWETLLDRGVVRAFDPTTMHADVERLVATGGLP